MGSSLLNPIQTTRLPVRAVAHEFGGESWHVRRPDEPKFLPPGVAGEFVPFHVDQHLLELLGAPALVIGKVSVHGTPQVQQRRTRLTYSRRSALSHTHPPHEGEEQADRHEGTQAPEREVPQHPSPPLPGEEDAPISEPTPTHAQPLP